MKCYSNQSQWQFKLIVQSIRLLLQTKCLVCWFHSGDLWHMTTYVFHFHFISSIVTCKVWTVNQITGIQFKFIVTISQKISRDRVNKFTRINFSYNILFCKCFCHLIHVGLLLIELEGLKDLYSSYKIYIFYLF